MYRIGSCHLLLLPYARLISVGVVVAEAVLQQLTQRSLHTKETGAVGWATRAYAQKPRTRKVLLLAMLGHGDMARVLRAVMASMVVATVRAQAWPLPLLQRGLLQHTERHLLCRQEYGRLRVLASGPWERSLVVLVFALLARYIRLQQAVIMAWALVLGFLDVRRNERRTTTSCFGRIMSKDVYHVSRSKKTTKLAVIFTVIPLELSPDSIDDPAVPLECNLCGHPLFGQKIEKIMIEEGWRKVAGCERPNLHHKVQ